MRLSRHVIHNNVFEESPRNGTSSIFRDSIFPYRTLVQIAVQNKILGDTTSRVDPFLRVNALPLPSYHLHTNIMFINTFPVNFNVLLNNFNAPNVFEGSFELYRNC